MEKEHLLPPPYENETLAYPKRQPRRRVFVRSLLSIRTINSVLITASILYLCYFFTSRHLTTPLWSGALEEEPEAARNLQHFTEAVTQCKALYSSPSKPDPKTRSENPRWTSTNTNAQQKTIIIRNARLFDGENWISDEVDITFSQGLIRKISKAGELSAASGDVIEHNVHGRYVTPGLVDMHGHQIISIWPAVETNQDDNEINPEMAEITSQLRALDGLKAYGGGAHIVASGGVTSSLILPGSANIIGGEAVPVKNYLYSGEHGEPVVDEVLLERGLPAEERRRYMKMAFGENPKRIWKHSRMGVAWLLREHLQKAKEVREKQDDYCNAVSNSEEWEDWKKHAWYKANGKLAFDLKLESTIALLRGQVMLQNHNYEPQDMEAMLRISDEFGFRVWGFHHAIEAWKVPEMLKEKAANITIATFAEFSGYKWEAYFPNLHAGHILDKHGVTVAYKSDHVQEFTNAKDLLAQAAVAHAFLLPEEKALRSVTSIPARAIDQDHRIGYARVGYDADIVVWNEHPLAIGATPLEVFIDGNGQLDQAKVFESMGENFDSERKTASTEKVEVEAKPQVRYEPEGDIKNNTCALANSPNQNFVIRGIRKAFLKTYPELLMADGTAFQGTVVNETTVGVSLTMVIAGGKAVCMEPLQSCDGYISTLKETGQYTEVKLQNGHVAPGGVALSAGLGMREIAMLDSTGDGEAKDQKLNDPDSITYAKYGLSLDSSQFARARLGGVTRAITAPFTNGFVEGVSVEFVTSGKKNLADGIIQGEVALHLTLGDLAIMTEGTVSNGIRNLRKMIQDGKSKFNETVYGRVARGELPVVVVANNKASLQ